MTAILPSLKEHIRVVAGGLICHSLIALGHAERARNVALSGEHITPLLFHNPTPELFGGCVDWLASNGYVFISSDELTEIVRHKKAPPRGAVWISLDDGWKGNLENVIPTVVDHDIPVTIFISTDAVQNAGVFWWSLAAKHRNDLPAPFRGDIGQLWAVREQQRKEVIMELERKSSRNGDREALTIDDVIQISQIPQVTIGCHTVHHVVTPNCTDAEIAYEIQESKRTLESWTGKTVRYFSYPNGDYDGRESGILKRYGFELAATSDKRLISGKEDPYLVPRISVMDRGYQSEAICRMVGIRVPLVEFGKKLGFPP